MLNWKRNVSKNARREAVNGFVSIEMSLNDARNKTIGQKLLIYSHVEESWSPIHSFFFLIPTLKQIHINNILNMDVSCRREYWKNYGMLHLILFIFIHPSIHFHHGEK